MKPASYVCILFLIVCGLIYFFLYDPTTSVRASSGRTYRVCTCRPDKQGVAEALDMAYSNMLYLAEYMTKSGLPNQKTADRTLSRIRNMSLRDAGKFDTEVAFTLFKGYTMRLCVSTSVGGIENRERILHVALHEMAHIMSSSFSHSREFTDNFYFLQQVAYKLNIIREPESFPRGTTYCGRVF